MSDPYDYLSPFHTWSVVFKRATLDKRLGALVPGRFRRMGVVARTPAGRAKLVEIEGSDGVVQVEARELRTRLGLRSTWFSIKEV